jgi:hypothetical protein
MKSIRIRHSAAWLRSLLVAVALVPLLAAAAAPSKLAIESVAANDEMSVVHVHGTGFGAGAPTVTLGGKALRMLTNDGTTITARLAPGTAPGKYAVVVTRADGKSARFAAVLPVAPPVPAPKAAAEGKGPVIEGAGANADMTVLTVQGKRFGAGAPTIVLGGRRLQLLTNDGTTIAARLAAKTAAGSYPLVLTRADGQSAVVDVTLGQ